MDLITGQILCFAMVLTRVSAFFLVLPVFGWQSIPVQVKAAITILVALFFSLTAPFAVGLPAAAGLGSGRGVSVLEAILLLSNEAIYGLSMGLIAASVFSAVKVCGQIAEQQMGLSMAEILDPLTGEMGQPLAMLMETIFIILFLSANGHHLFLLTICRSYEAFPAGTIPTLPIMIGGIVQAGSTLLIAGLRLAAPMLAAFLLLMVVLGVIARIAPETEILFISLPLQVGLGLMLAALFIPFVNGFVAEFADWMGKLLPL
jgi:flagellar biosynthetic protein FliR